MGTSTPTPCKKGEYSTQGSTQCKKCNVGTVSELAEGSTQCIPKANPRALHTPHPDQVYPVTEEYCSLLCAQTANCVAGVVTMDNRCQLWQGDCALMESDIPSAACLPLRYPPDAVELVPMPPRAAGAAVAATACPVIKGPSWTMCTSDQLLAQKRIDTDPQPVPGWHTQSGQSKRGGWKYTTTAPTKLAPGVQSVQHWVVDGEEENAEEEHVYCCNARPLQCTAPPGTAPSLLNCTGLDADLVLDGVQNLCRPAQCTCANGVPQVGKECSEDGESCAACHPGYTLTSDNTCIPTPARASGKCPSPSAQLQAADVNGTLCAARPMNRWRPHIWTEEENNLLTGPSAPSGDASAPED